MKRRVGRLGGLAGLLGLVAIGLVACSGEPEVPLPDLADAEGPVRAKLTGLRKRVLAAPSADTWGHFARTLDAHDMLQEAEKAYLAAAALASGDAAFEHYHLAGVAVFESHPQRAREHFTKAIAIRKDSYTTRLHLARLLETLDEFDAAKQQYEYLSAAGVSAYALLGLGRIALRNGDAKTAVAHLRQAAVADSANRRIFEALARAYARLGRKQESQDAARKAGDVADHRPFADPLRPKVEAECVHSIARFRRGTDLARAKRYREAIAEFRAGLEARPDEVLAHFNLARALDLVGEKDAARKELDWILARHPEHAGAKALRATMRVP